MLYTAAQEALSELMRNNSNKTGEVQLVFNVDGNAVVHADYVDGGTDGVDLQLQPAEFAVRVALPAAPPAELSCAYAAINAVNALSLLVVITIDDRGDMPTTKGLVIQSASLKQSFSVRFVDDVTPPVFDILFTDVSGVVRQSLDVYSDEERAEMAISELEASGKLPYGWDECPELFGVSNIPGELTKKLNNHHG